MNKVFNINLGGYTFTIDEDAYYHLKQYLGAIDSHFKNSEGFEDITTDIEIRLSELFKEKLKGRQIVNIKDVSEAINIMGTPEDFGATSDYTGIPEEEEIPNASQTTATKKDWSNHKFGKRLYRNSDETIVGGVASGISAYLGVEDPVWIRIAMAVLILFGGVSFVFYIILWAVLPEAKTAKQKLEMRGERIDVNNIAKTFEEELKHVTDKFSELGGNGKKKKKNGKESDDKVSYGSNNTIKEGIAFVRQTSGALERFVRTVAKPLIFIIGIGLMLFVGLLWIALIVGSVLGYPYLDFIFPSSQVPIVSTLGFMALSIPIIGIALTIIRVFFRTKIWKGIPIILAITGVVAVSSLFYFLTNTAREFEEENKITQVVEYPQLVGDVIEIKANPMKQNGSKLHFGKTKISNNQLLHGSVSLTFKKADGDIFELKQVRSARGLDMEQAKTLANSIEYIPVVEGNTLHLDEFIKQSHKSKWRNQQLELELSIPEGKSVQLDYTMQDLIHRADLKAKNGHFHGWQLHDAIIQAETDGLVVSGFSGQPFGSKHESEYKDFSELTLEGNLKVYIDKGDKFEFSTEGDHHHNNIDVNQNGSVLNVQGPSYDDRPTKVYITLPSLDKLTAHNVGDIWLRSLDQDALEIEIDGETEVHGQGLQIVNLIASLKDEAELTLKGSGTKMNITVIDDAKFDADRFKVDNATITGKQDAYIKLNVLDTLSGSIEEDVDLKLEGQPKVSLMEQQEQ